MDNITASYNLANNAYTYTVTSGNNAMLSFMMILMHFNPEGSGLKKK